MKKVTQDQEHKNVDEKNKVLMKLRALNLRLRKRLKDLNVKVEKAIDRTYTKRMLAARQKKDFDIPHRIRVKEKELENADQQLQAYKREIESLKLRIDEISQVDKMLDMEQDLKDNKQACLDLKKQIKDLEKMSKDKGKALERLTDGDDYNYKIRNMIDEIRMWKEKIKHREEVYDRNENTVQLQGERMSAIEKENQVLMDKIQKIDSKLDLEPSKATRPADEKALENLNNEKIKAKEKYELVQANNNKELKQVEKEISELTAKRDALYTKMKELDQEQRISTLKLREVGRILKHNQLKPLSPVRKSVAAKRSDTGSKHSMGKRSSTSNLLALKTVNKDLDAIKPETKKLTKGGNTQSTQLLNKKEYSKPKDDDSDEDFEKNQVIDYEKFKEQQNKKDNTKLGAIKANKGNRGTFETRASLK